MWDLTDGRQVYTEGESGHDSSVNAAIVSVDGHHVISTNDATLKMWDLTTGYLEHTLSGHSTQVTAVTVTPDGRRVVSGSDDGTLKVWDLGSGQEEHSLIAHDGHIKTIIATPGGLRAVSGSTHHTLRFWDLVKASLITTFHCDGGVDAIGCAFSEHGQTYLAGDSSGAVHVLRLEE